MNSHSTPLMDEGLAKFLRPEIEDIRADIVFRWKAKFGDETLSDEIFENPRLKPRLIAAICASRKQPRERSVPVREDGDVVAALIVHGSQTVAEMVGCLCHRKVVMDWVTWNQLSERMPQVDLALLRHCLRRGKDLPLESGFGVRGAQPSYEHILRMGKQGLSGWRRQAAPELVKRLNLFVTLPPPASFTKEAEILRLLAPVLLEAQG